FDVSKPQWLYIESHQNSFPGVSVEELPVRTYPYGTMAAHVLGYTGQVSSQQLKDPAYAGYEPGDIVGKAGVEQVYEKYLQGTKDKPFVAAAALRAGVATENGSYACPATYTAPTDTTGQQTVFHNWTTANLGTMSLSEALIQSCDTVFYQFGWDFYQRSPAEPLQRDLGAFGFGKPTLVDLPNEQPGVVPTPE